MQLRKKQFDVEIPSHDNMISFTVMPQGGSLYLHKSRGIVVESTIKCMVNGVAEDFVFKTDGVGYNEIQVEVPYEFDGNDELKITYTVNDAPSKQPTEDWADDYAGAGGEPGGE